MKMLVLVINAGSSSLKYRLFDMSGDSIIAGGVIERIGQPGGHVTHQTPWGDRLHGDMDVPDQRTAMAEVVRVLQETGAITNFAALHAVGHRVVHGGEQYLRPVVVTPAILKDLQALDALAPLHNPANRLGIEVTLEIAPTVPQVAVFDTAFHHTLPPHAYLYALPYRLYNELGVRRYGFHGTSHAYVAGEAAHLLGRERSKLNVISLHLGNGASATAVQGGQSIDTSMGMTPLEGLIMGTRSGDIDPSVVAHVARTGGMEVSEVQRMLNEDSGLKGICGHSDMRDVEQRASAGDKRAALALDMVCYRIKKYIGAYTAVLARVDAVVFTGGIGEHSALVRAQSCRGLEALGIRLDSVANAASSDVARDIATADSPVRILVIPTDEEKEIARQTMACIAMTSGDDAS